MVDFRLTREEFDIVRKIVKRARTMPGISAVDLDMDLSAAHRNGCPLDFGKLLAFDDFNFLHDIHGIHSHIDRATGELTDCFVPRCAAHETATV